MPVRLDRAVLKGCRVAVWRPGEGPSALVELCRALGATQVVPTYGPEADFCREANDRVVVSSEHKWAMPADAARSPGVLTDLHLLRAVIPHARLVGITGSNGKTSTCVFLHRLLAAAGLQPQLTGHLSTDGLAPSPAQVALGIVGGAHVPDIVVCEVAAHQAAALARFRFDVACVTNFCEAVEERIGPPKRVRRAIQSLLWRGRTRVFDAGDASIHPPVARDHVDVRFGCSRHDQSCIHWSGRGLWQRRFDRWKLVASFAQRHFSWHPQNVAAAVATAVGLGIELDRAVVEQVSRGDPCMPHRIELVGRLNDVEFVNDAKSTNPEATAATVRLLARRTVLIIGGADRGQPLARLTNMRARLTALIAYGELAQRATREMSGINVLATDGVRGAFSAALAHAAPGDVILFSPAAPSGETEHDYRQRGAVFRELVDRAMSRTNR